MDHPCTQIPVRECAKGCGEESAGAEAGRTGSIKEFQFRDLRAKAGTDKEESAGMAAAKDQLGHADEQMARRYVRHRKGKLVTPTR